MEELLLQFISGLLNAMFLFLLASGLSLIFGVSRVLNLTHGSLCQEELRSWTWLPQRGIVAACDRTTAAKRLARMALIRKRSGKAKWESKGPPGPRV